MTGVQTCALPISNAYDKKEIPRALELLEKMVTLDQPSASESLGVLNDAVVFEIPQSIDEEGAASAGLENDQARYFTPSQDIENVADLTPKLSETDQTQAFNAAMAECPRLAAAHAVQGDKTEEAARQEALRVKEETAQKVISREEARAKEVLHALHQETVANFSKKSDNAFVRLGQRIARQWTRFTHWVSGLFKFNKPTTEVVETAATADQHDVVDVALSKKDTTLTASRDASHVRQPEAVCSNASSIPAPKNYPATNGGERLQQRR